MSAPFRYARILNGLSFLISRRSAISPRMRAMARLSNAEAFHLDLEIEHACSARREGVGDRLARRGRSIAEEAPASAGAAYLGRRGAGPRCAGDQILDRR